MAGVSVTVKGTERVRLGGEYNANTSPIDALKMYLKIKKIPEKRTNLLIDKASSIIENSGNKNNAEHS